MSQLVLDFIGVSLGLLLASAAFLIGSFVYNEIIIWRDHK